MIRRFVCLVAGVALLLAGCRGSARPLRFSTTTSVDGTGLLDVLLPAFEEAEGLQVDAIAVGSGKALQLARRGDADLTLTHDPELERTFLAEGRAALYRKIMFNDFLIVGPPEDPAGVRGAAGVVDAMRRIAVSTALFASRGDSSGTEAREKLLWSRAGQRPSPDRMLETGQAMAPTLRVASEKGAYCLTDRASFAQLEAALNLRPVFEGGSDLLNTYAVMVVGQPDSARQAGATRLAVWLSDGAGRDLIARFRVKGAQAFTVWPAGMPREAPVALPR